MNKFKQNRQKYYLLKNEVKISLIQNSVLMLQLIFLNVNKIFQIWILKLNTTRISVNTQYQIEEQNFLVSV